MAVQGMGCFYYPDAGNGGADRWDLVRTEAPPPAAVQFCCSQDTDQLRHWLNLQLIDPR
jgi:hypothetical protein